MAMVGNKRCPQCNNTEFNVIKREEYFVEVLVYQFGGSPNYNPQANSSSAAKKTGISKKRWTLSCPSCGWHTEYASRAATFKKLRDPIDVDAEEHDQWMAKKR